MTTTIGPALGQGAVMNQATSYDAISVRRMLEGVAAEGIIGEGSFAVTQRGAGANMSVDIAASTGSGARVRGDAVTLQSLYYVAPSSAVINEAITAAHATLPRNDLVVLEIKDHAHDASGSSLAQTRVVTGTATAGAAATDALGVNGTPTLPASAIPLAVVNVPALDTAITDSQIDDRRYRTSGKSIVATEEARTNTAYGLLTTPDRVRNVVLPPDCVILVAFQALWKESNVNQARAAIHIGSNQLKIRQGSAAAPVTSAAMFNTAAANAYRTLLSCPLGLVSHEDGVAASDDVTTGQAVGMIGQSGTSGFMEIGGSSVDIGNADPNMFGGACLIFAAAGVYDISVMWKAGAGSVTAKGRKLWVWTQTFPA